jgi:hypothetical protein
LRFNGEYRVGRVRVEPPDCNATALAVDISTRLSAQLEQPFRVLSPLPLDDVVDVDHFWWAGELDSALGEDRHLALTERRNWR